MSTVTVKQFNEVTQLSAPVGSTLLEVLRRGGFAVEAPCGGNGTCGKCRVAVTDSAGTRWVLACQTVVRADCTVEVGGTAAGEVLARSAGVALPIAPRQGYGAAVDLGTTTVAMELLDLRDGKCLGTQGAWNAQRAYGADVVTRAQYAMEHADGLPRLTALLRTQLLDLLDQLCQRHQLPADAVQELFVAGNTVMQHLLSGLSPKTIVLAPYTPLSLFTKAGYQTWPERPDLRVYVAPCVAGYVGGDIVAGLLSSGLYGRAGNALFLDIGTNGEMALGGQEGFTCCAVASGPAFEGAELSCGMTAGPGALTHVGWAEGELQVETLGDAPLAGICGSGYIDLLALLLRLGAVDEGGRLLPPEEAPPMVRPWLRADEMENGIFYLTPEVYLTAGDVRKLQLAKAAVAAGIDVLLSWSGLAASDLEALYLAGGFGNRIDPASAAAIGMFPKALQDKTVCLGNSALAGARAGLMSPAAREMMGEIQRRCRYRELSGDQAFTDAYVDHMIFT